MTTKTDSEELTDAYLATLLARDARKMDGSSGQRPRDAPKPNTRFLKSIIRDTTSHNAALLERERRKQDDLHRTTNNPEADRHSAKRFKAERPDRWATALSVESSRDRQHLRKSHTDDVDKSQRRHCDDDRAVIAGQKQKHRRRRSERSPPDIRPARHERISRAPSKSPNHTGERTYRKEKSSRPKRNSTRLARSRSPARSPSRTWRPERSRRVARQRSSDSHPSEDTKHGKHEDSDPLDDLLGPLPAGHVRGRGRLGGASGIDARFADAAYDPRLDTGDDDAYHDSLDGADFKERHTAASIDPQRFLTAGFSADEVKRFVGPVDGNDVEDVVWQKQGQAREWDRNKPIDDALS